MVPYCNSGILATTLSTNFSLISHVLRCRLLVFPTRITSSYRYNKKLQLCMNWISFDYFACLHLVRHTKTRNVKVRIIYLDTNTFTIIYQVKLNTQYQSDLLIVFFFRCNRLITQVQPYCIRSVKLNAF